jgi:hypothetical protein
MPLIDSLSRIRDRLCLGRVITAVQAAGEGMSDEQRNILLATLLGAGHAEPPNINTSQRFPSSVAITINNSTVNILCRPDDDPPSDAHR